ncbi:MAG: aminotransferase class I/II-fold pyridoxal phosphate-dependent enzyme [Candidatus Melainabacteria bacterium]|nr:MAG: aminotransferase class I/II-fold pyridoxal phosphate-dependent enzyme [Candidatus Melainabacteria bacterium]
MAKSRLADRIGLIFPSNIRGAMRLNAAATAAGTVVNLAQGLPEFNSDEILKGYAIDAINANYDKYLDTWGHPPLRQAISAKYKAHYNRTVDAEQEVVVTCGTSEAIALAIFSLVNPGDEVIVLEPFYENYPPNIVTAGGVPRFVKLHAPDWTFDRKELAAAFNKRTRAIILNTPHNPTSRVFTKDELEFIASLCVKWDVMAITDEIYEHMVFDGERHLALANVPGMEDRTITCSGVSKTFNVTGWRIGWAVAPKDVCYAMQRLHDYTTLVAPSAFQVAAIKALSLPQSFYDDLTLKYEALRDEFAGYVENANFKFIQPQGTYFLYADASHLGFEDDKATTEYLRTQKGLAVVAGFGFYRPNTRTQHIRFCFAKYPATLRLAGEKLATL